LKKPTIALPHFEQGSLLVPAELAKILRVPTSWVYSHHEQLPTIRLGRYLRWRLADVLAYLEKQAACE
jgi:predicted DNA-binding transcriptional regulator AlpA